MTKVEMVEAIKVLTNTLQVLLGIVGYNRDEQVETVKDKIEEYIKML